MNKNTERAKAKMAYVKELLSKNPYMPTEDANKAVQAKFGHEGDARPGGLSRVAIANARWELHGIAMGPGGRFFDKSGAQIDVPQQFKPVIPASPPPPTVSSDAERQQRMAGMLHRLKEEMAAQGIKSLTVPLEGPVAAIQTVQIRRDLKI